MRLLLLLPVALAAPATLSLREEAGADVLDARWKDPSDAAYSVSAPFPAGAVRGAQAAAFDLDEIRVELARRLNDWAATNAPLVQVRVDGTQLGFSARGAGATEQVQRVQGERERIYDTILAERHLMRAGPGLLQFDGAAIAADTAPAVQPLADAIGGMLEARDFASRALALVQGIPYDKVTDDTFAGPLALLRLHHGDCDEKSTLYLALLRAAEPKLPLALFTTDGHAFVGLALSPRAHEQTIDVDGTTWLVAEPVGPAVVPLGQLSPRSKEALEQGAVQLRRVPTR